MAERRRVVVAAGAAARDELLPAIEAALLALELDVRVVALARGGVLDRALAALAGEIGARRLERELVGPPLADVALALDLAAAEGLARERARGVPVPVIALCEELAPRAAWATRIDRFVCLDDEAAVALSERGVDGARVTALGAAVGRAWIDVAERSRAEVRAELRLPPEGQVALIDAAALGSELTGQLLVQLALADHLPTLVFDAAADDAVAQLVRRQVPRLGLGGKLVSEAGKVAAAWRAADVIVGRGGASARLRALAVGAGTLAVEPGDDALAELRALASRGAAQITPLLGVTVALADASRWAAMGQAAGQIGGVLDGADPLARVAELCAQVARERAEVLAEPFADVSPPGADAARDADEPRSARPLDDDGLEDLGGPAVPRAAQAAAAAPPPRGPRLDDELEQLKRAQAQKRSSVDDELAALKARMQKPGAPKK